MPNDKTLDKETSDVTGAYMHYPTLILNSEIMQKLQMVTATALKIIGYNCNKELTYHDEYFVINTD